GLVIRTAVRHFGLRLKAVREVFWSQRQPGIVGQLRILREPRLVGQLRLPQPLTFPFDPHSARAASSPPFFFARRTKLQTGEVLGRNGSGKVAGAGGFEPPHGGIKIRCLTTWLRPIVGSQGT